MASQQCCTCRFDCSGSTSQARQAAVCSLGCCQHVCEVSLLLNVLCCIQHAHSSSSPQDPSCLFGPYGPGVALKRFVTAWRHHSATDEVWRKVCYTSAFGRHTPLFGQAHPSECLTLSDPITTTLLSVLHTLGHRHRGSAAHALLTRVILIMPRSFPPHGEA